MIQPPQIILAMIATWLAATVSGAAGFGGALLLLPLLTAWLGPGKAIPLLTLVQLVGNLSRAGLGWREIRWPAVGLFLAGALPGSLAGGLLFVRLPAELVSGGIGVVLLLFVGSRRLGLLPHQTSARWLLPGGLLVGFISGLAGSAGPLGAALFLGLNLPPVAYVASEAVTAVAMHITKTAVYQHNALLDLTDWGLGALLGLAAMAGSWTGKRLIEHLPWAKFRLLVEGLLVAMGMYLLLSSLL